jgi:hypothetical protein
MPNLLPSMRPHALKSHSALDSLPIDAPSHLAPAADAGSSQRLYGSRSSVRYSGASVFALAMKEAWASWSSTGGRSVRDVTG